MSKNKKKTPKMDSTNTFSPDKRDSKKAVVLGTKRKKPEPLLVGAVGCIILAIGFFYFFSQDKGNNLAQPENPSVSASGNSPLQVTHSVNLFADGNARHFKFAHDGLSIKYFVLKSADGVIRAAFDACDVCWRAGKGYYQAGDFMVCRNCGREFASVLVNEVKGGCNPAPLTRSIKGDQVVIQVSDIIEGKQYFDFSGKA